MTLGVIGAQSFGDGELNRFFYSEYFRIWGVKCQHWETWDVWFSVFFPLPYVQCAKNFRSAFPSCFLDICSLAVSRNPITDFRKKFNLKVIYVYCRGKKDLLIQVLLLEHLLCVKHLGYNVIIMIMLHPLSWHSRAGCKK